MQCSEALFDLHSLGIRLERGRLFQLFSAVIATLLCLPAFVQSIFKLDLNRLAVSSSFHFFLLLLLKIENGVLQSALNKEVLTVFPHFSTFKASQRKAKERSATSIFCQCSHFAHCFSNCQQNPLSLSLCVCSTAAQANATVCFRGANTSAKSSVIALSGFFLFSVSPLWASFLLFLPFFLWKNSPRQTLNTVVCLHLLFLSFSFFATAATVCSAFLSVTFCLSVFALA